MGLKRPGVDLSGVEVSGLKWPGTKWAITAVTCVMFSLHMTAVTTGIHFNHIKHSRAFSGDLYVILENEIQCPFSAFFNCPKYIIFDLFNRHI